MMWDWNFKKSGVCKILCKITNLESLQPMTETRGTNKIVAIFPRWLFSFWTRPDQSHTVLTSTSKEMTFEFQTVEKKITKKFSLFSFFFS